MTSIVTSLDALRQAVKVLKPANSANLARDLALPVGSLDAFAEGKAILLVWLLAFRAFHVGAAIRPRLDGMDIEPRARLSSSRVKCLQPSP